MSRIEEALKKAAGTPGTEGAPIRDRFAIAAKPRARVDDYVAESPGPAISAPPASFVEPSLVEPQAKFVEPQAKFVEPHTKFVEPQPRKPEPPVVAPVTSGPTLARVPPSVDVKPVAPRTIDPASVEQYRRLAASLHSLQGQRGIKILMVTSSMPREGKTLTAVNLALTLSEYRRRVLLIDADMRRPSVHELFGVPNRVGLGDGLRAPGTTLTLVNSTEHLTLLTAGRPDPNPAAGLASERMRVVLKEAAERFDWVIVDTPPVGMLSDASLIGSFVDGVVFVVAAGTTERQVVERAINEIGRERIIGTVLNRVASTASPRHDTYYESAESPEIFEP
jgi:capsular exopolysaccharide synthesis family protein